jgi:hypothetical protein
LEKGIWSGSSGESPGYTRRPVPRQNTPKTPQSPKTSRKQEKRRSS